MRTDAFATGANARQNLATPASTKGTLRVPFVLCLQVNLDAEFVLANLDAARWHTSPLVKQGFASDRDLPGLQSHACNEAYVLSETVYWLANSSNFEKSKHLFETASSGNFIFKSYRDLALFSMSKELITVISFRSKSMY